MDDYKQFMGSYSSYMDSYKKFMGGAQGGGYQKYMDWQKYTVAGGYQKYMDWQKKYMGASSLTAVASKERSDSLKYTPRATSLAFLLCAASAFAVGFVFIREKLSRRRDSSTDYIVIV